MIYAFRDIIYQAYTGQDLWMVYCGRQACDRSFAGITNLVMATPWKPCEHQ